MKNKLVFIGNSIVNGFPFSRGNSFPGRIRAAVKEGKASFHCDVINKGCNGETTADILQRFDHDVLDHEPLAAFIMTGTNDFIYREADPDQCLDNLALMAAKAAESGIVPVYMTPLLTDAEKASRMWMAGMGMDYEEINAEIEAFARGIRESEELFIDTGEAFRAWANGLEDPSSAYHDGVHPTKDGYAFLAETVLSWIEDHKEDLHLI